MCHTRAGAWIELSCLDEGDEPFGLVDHAGPLLGQQKPRTFQFDISEVVKDLDLDLNSSADEIWQRAEEEKKQALGAKASKEKKSQDKNAKKREKLANCPHASGQLHYRGRRKGRAALQPVHQEGHACVRHERQRRSG